MSIHPAELLLACILDLLIGDPRWLPHPVRGIGKAITWFEGMLRRAARTVSSEKAAGIMLVLCIVPPAFFFTYVLRETLLSFEHPVMRMLGAIVIVYLISTTIAVRELIASARAVIDSVKNSDIETARQSLSMIVGRDTQNLSEQEILKATMETLSENLSDGIIAPLFYLVIGGLPLAIAYKAVNTLDSMVGYRNERYINFGWASARLDDIANYIPARISGFLVVIASVFVFGSLSVGRSSLHTMLRDGRKHLSPNSGMPEAAVAGALGVSFGGPSIYGGMLVEKPFIGDKRETDYLKASEKTIIITRVTALLGIVLVGGILTVRCLL
ncbi:MAG: cobalamin biosynthesis protein CobD [Nitrospirae bacterium]|nr:MAG: cobalamin biosynthesis protein CobD [Nitrospirota bacterium]